MKKTFKNLLDAGYYVVFYRGSKGAAYCAKARYGFYDVCILRHHRWGFVALARPDSGYCAELGTTEIWYDLVSEYIPYFFEEMTR